MSAGHGDVDIRGLSAVTINRLLENPEIKRRLYTHGLDRSHDLPYLGGYSEDGQTVYIDRHLPETISYQLDGRKCSFCPDQHIMDHECFEKAVMDVLGWNYEHAHEAANGYERRGVLKAGLLWQPYNKALYPFIKADEHEKLKNVPRDLDMKPYYSPPVDKKLIAHMEAAMGRKQSKKDVDYEAVASMPSQKCSKCEHFEKPDSCMLVRGIISPGAWCKLFEAKT